MLEKHAMGMHCVHGVDGNVGVDAGPSVAVAAAGEGVHLSKIVFGTMRLAAASDPMGLLDVSVNIATTCTPHE